MSVSTNPQGGRDYTECWLKVSGEQNRLLHTSICGYFASSACDVHVASLQSVQASRNKCDERSLRLFAVFIPVLGALHAAESVGRGILNLAGASGSLVCRDTQQGKRYTQAAFKNFSVGTQGVWFCMQAGARCAQGVNALGLPATPAREKQE